MAPTGAGTRETSLDTVLDSTPATNMKLTHGLFLMVLACPLAGCDQLGIDTPAAEAAREEAEGKAIGGACRQSGRALEDCYQINRRAPKAAIFSGWRDMDAYMRENKIEEIKPESAAKPATEQAAAPAAAKDAAAPAPAKPAEGAETPAAKPATAKAEKPAEKPAEAAAARKSRPALAR